LQPRFVPAPREKPCRPIDKSASLALLVLGAMAVALSPNELERTIEVLSSAGQTLELSRLERITYRALLVSVDVTMASFFAFIVVVIFASLTALSDIFGSGTVSWPWILAGILVVVFVVSLFIGIASLAANIPLLLKTYREGERLKRLGLGSLSTSLWKESRRSRWISRLRGALLLGIGILIMVGIVFASKGMLEASTSEDRISFFVGLLFYAIIAGLLFAARYLRNQRERMDLAASAEQVRKALQSLQAREGPEFVSVPAELLERTAIIESAQITKERKDAVLQSAAFRPDAYAIAFDRNAAEQRATLGVADRVELEDLVADLSTEGSQLEAKADAVPGTKAVTVRGTESKNVEIEYVVDQASRRIQVVAVRHGGDASQASPKGAGDA
jgi:hypothetical protein